MKENPMLTSITAIPVSALAAFGGIACLASGFAVEGMEYGALFLCCLITAAVFALCMGLRLGLVPLCAGALLLGFLWNRIGLGSSLEALVFHISDLLDRGYGWGVVRWSSEELTQPALAVYILGAIHGAVLAALLMWPKSRWLSTFATVLPVFSCMILTDTAPAPWALAITFGAFLLQLLSQHARNRSLLQGSRLTAMLALPLSLAMLFMFLAFPPETYRGQELAQKLEDWVLSLFREEEEEAPPAPDPLIYPVIGGDDPVLNCVNLTAVGPKEESWSLVMKVRAPESGYLYLRGNAYNYYTGTTWMHNGVGVQWPNDQFDRTGTLMELEITTQQTHGILYSTYNPTLDPAPTAGRIVNSKREKSYTVSYLRAPQFDEKWEQLIDYTLLAYNDPTQQVTCLKLPTEAANWAGDVLHDFDWYAGNRQYSAYGTWALAHEIAEYVARSTAYSLDTPSMPSGETDFVSWFMQKSPSGYCVHFATAAAVLLRQAGIPARYVTGYLVAAKADQPVTVRQKDAHAWVEYFVPGIGWMPLEATPGYYERVNSIPKQEEETTPTTVPETTQPTVEETTQPATQPSQTSETTQPTTQPTTQKEQEKRNSGPILIGLLILLGLALTALQWRLRVWLWQWRKQRSDPAARMLLEWREAQRLCRRLKEAPPEEIRLLALNARFGPDAPTARQLHEMERYLNHQKRQLRQKPWYARLCYTLILAIY